MYQYFTWRGKPVADINKWAMERGECMVHYKAQRYVPNMLTGRVELEVEYGSMPESFWDGLLMSGGWHYEELSRSGTGTQEPHGWFVIWRKDSK